MQTVIFCGGKGTRMKEETEFKPKPMVRIGEAPILWHIMKIYAHHGFNEFILPLGYKGEMIRDYFSDDLQKKNNFKITFVETGEDASTGERLLAVKKYLRGEDFMVTYGDGVGDIDIKAVAAQHKSKNVLGTVTAARPRSQFGLMDVDKASGLITNFRQKPIIEDYVNVGFMVLKNSIFEHLKPAQIEDTLSLLASSGKLAAYYYGVFWKSADTYAELEELNSLWKSSKPWAVWQN